MFNHRLASGRGLNYRLRIGSGPKISKGYARLGVLGNPSFLRPSFSQTSNTSSSKVCRYALIFGYSRASINSFSLAAHSKTPAGSIWNHMGGETGSASWFETELQSARPCLLNRWQQRFLLIYRHIPSVFSIQLPPAGLGVRPLQVAISPACRISVLVKDTM